MALSLKEKDNEEATEKTEIKNNYNNDQYNVTSVINEMPDYNYNKSATINTNTDNRNAAGSGMSQDLINKITFISGIVIYVLYALYVLYVVKIAIGGPESISAAFKSMSVVAAILSIVTIADSVFIFIFVEKNILIIICAVFLSVLYPYLRGKIVNGNNDIIGLALVSLFVISMIFLVINTAKSTMNYGTLGSISDENTRNEAIAVMDSEMASGKTYAKAMINGGVFVPRNAELKNTGGKARIMMSGDGYISGFKEYTIEASSSPVPTVVTFEKVNSGYEIVGLQINGVNQDADAVSSYIAALNSL